MLGLLGTPCPHPTPLDPLLQHTHTHFAKSAKNNALIHWKSPFVINRVAGTVVNSGSSIVVVAKNNFVLFSFLRKTFQQ